MAVSNRSPTANPAARVGVEYVIKWSKWGYVANLRSNRKPFTQDPSDPDTKTWKTYKAAERFLSLKDPLWASTCVIEERRKKPASNPRGRPAPLINYLENVDSYVVSPKEKWLAEILYNSDPDFPEIAHPERYEWRMYASVPIRRLKPGKIGGTGSDWPILVNHRGEVVSGTERLAVQNWLKVKTVTVIVATPIDKDA